MKPKNSYSNTYSTNTTVAGSSTGNYLLRQFLEQLHTHIKIIVKVNTIDWIFYIVMNIRSLYFTVILVSHSLVLINSLRCNSFCIFKIYEIL